MTSLGNSTLDLAGGTRIEGYFDAQRWAKYFMRIWLGFAVLMGTPIFVRTVIDVVSGSHYMSGDKWVGLLEPVSYMPQQDLDAA
jgi:hypothetical protein